MRTIEILTLVNLVFFGSTLYAFMKIRGLQDRIINTLGAITGAISTQYQINLKIRKILESLAKNKSENIDSEFEILDELSSRK